MATLDAYKEQLETWKAQGLTKAMMLRKLQDGGVEISKSTLYPYVDNLGNQAAAEGPNREAMGAFQVSVVEEIQQLHATMNKVLQAVLDNEAESTERHQLVMKTLANGNHPVMPSMPSMRIPGYSMPPIRRFALPSLNFWKIKRVVLVTGVLFLAWMLWSGFSLPWFWLQARLFFWKWL